MNYISTETERQMNKWTETQRDRKGSKTVLQKYVKNDIDQGFSTFWYSRTPKSGL